ncbi:MAG: hypothetical protein IH793_04880, partial [Acidobacteria bacterium]|nr:hypothetical protein [Acidobacteriota bacterium]
RLVVFAACDRILIEESGIASLISIIDEFTLTIKGDTKIGRDAVGPTQWAIYTKWEKTSGDDDKEFVQIIQALWPDKSEFKRMKAPFRFQPDKKGHQNRIEINGFPMGQEGLVTLNMWLEVDSKRIGEIHTWTVNIKHETAKA